MGHAILVRHRRTSRDRLAREHPEARIIDVTSQGGDPWRRLSPMFPHGGIPVPGQPGLTSTTVEGIWQGLKVFQHEGPDLTLLQWTGRGPIKRSSRARGAGGAVRGAVLGHRWGTDTLLEYIEARRRIYLPAYLWMLANRAREELDRLRRLAEGGPIVLLDYATNDRVEDPSRPLSHAALIRAVLLGESLDADSSPDPA